MSRMDSDKHEGNGVHANATHPAGQGKEGVDWRSKLTHLSRAQEQQADVDVLRVVDGLVAVASCIDAAGQVERLSERINGKAGSD